MAQTIKNYDADRGFTLTIGLCDEGNVVSAEFVFDEPVPLLSFRPEMLFGPRTYSYMPPQESAPTRKKANLKRPCVGAGCGG